MKIPEGFVLFPKQRTPGRYPVFEQVVIHRNGTIIFSMDLVPLLGSQVLVYLNVPAHQVMFSAAPKPSDETYPVTIQAGYGILDGSAFLKILGYQQKIIRQLYDVTRHDHTILLQLPLGV